MNIGIIVSGGGHLDEALPLLGAFKDHRVFLVTYVQQSLLHFHHPDIERVYFVRLWGSKGIGLYLSIFINLFEFIYILLKERPNVLFSTGSEIAIIPFFLSKTFFRTKLIFLETATRVLEPSLTAKVLYPISDIFLVQWKTLVGRFGPKAQFRGRVF